MNDNQSLELANPELAIEQHEPQRLDVVPPKLDAAQSRIGYVAALLAKAYEKASMLELLPDEAKALMADFPDDAVSTGANGDANLLYIQHAYLRERLHQVFQPGRWTLVLRQTWAEDFTTGQGKPAARVYADCALLVRGCFVGDAVGTMIYFKNNATQNYSDALEGAKSSALSRIAGKDLSIGLQCWKKAYCDGWKARHKAGATPTPKTSPKPQEAAKEPAKASAEPIKPTEAMRNKFIDALIRDGIELSCIQDFAEKAKLILPAAEKVDEDYPLSSLPLNKAEYEALKAEIIAFRNGEQITPRK